MIIFGGPSGDWGETSLSAAVIYTVWGGGWGAYQDHLEYKRKVWELFFLFNLSLQKRKKWILSNVCYEIWRRSMVGQKVLFRFFLTSYKKTRMNFLANLIYTSYKHILGYTTVLNCFFILQKWQFHVNESNTTPGVSTHIFLLLWIKRFWPYYQTSTALPCNCFSKSDLKPWSWDIKLLMALVSLEDLALTPY